MGANVFLVQSVPPNSLVYYEEKADWNRPKANAPTSYDRDEFRE